MGAAWPVGIAVLLVAMPASAQQLSQASSQSPRLPAEMRPVGGSAPPPSTGSDRPLDDQEQKSDDQANNTSHDRLFWALPNFLTVENAAHVPPLTAKQKFDVTARSTFDLAEYAWYASLAGFDQVEHGEPTYGQGPSGYAKRSGLAFADGTIENFMVSAIFASTFRQDPRFYQLGHGSAWHRTGYAVSRLFVTRSDAGHAQFNVSEIAGSAVAAGLYNTYHPADERTIPHTLSSWWFQIGYDAISITVKEFWPDIRRKLSKDPK